MHVQRGGIDRYVKTCGAGFNPAEVQWTEVRGVAIQKVGPCPRAPQAQQVERLLKESLHATKRTPPSGLSRQLRLGGGLDLGRDRRGELPTPLRL